MSFCCLKLFYRSKFIYINKARKAKWIVTMMNEVFINCVFVSFRPYNSQSLMMCGFSKARLSSKSGVSITIWPYNSQSLSLILGGFSKARSYTSTFRVSFRP